MFIPHTDSEREQMLETIGVSNIADLFQNVPQEHRFPSLNLPPQLSEMEAVAHLFEIAAKNQPINKLTSFLGAGAYNHYVPAAVDTIILRGEFLTAYTPYQPEVSQGTLQAIFEYQSLIAALTGMDVSNASHYDGATAVAEAVNMAFHHYRGKRQKILLSPALNPQYRTTVKTYTQGTEIVLTGVDDHALLDQGPESIIPLIDKDTALVVVGYPDFFGRIYDYQTLADFVHEAGALFAVAVNPTALGMLKPPGEFGADIVIGDGQPLGIPLSFGGPYLGIFATKQKYVRRMAGRLAGETIDAKGQRGYVLTLATREQHIRREKATSNICTNQGLMALASTVYMSLLGKSGFRKVAELCYHKAHYAAEQISRLEGFSLTYDQQFFHEFVLQCPLPAEQINKRLLDKSIIGGYELSHDYPGMENHLLIAVTEMITKEQIDNLVAALEEVTHA